MDLKKEDRRVKYTKMVIKNSFVKLLKEKSISKISVKEICDDADVNRATFYSHYIDQYDLLLKIENEIIDDINQRISNYNLNDKLYESADMIQKILEYIEINSELFDLLLNTNGDIGFQQELIKIIGKQHFSFILHETSQNNEVGEYIFYFLASGSVGVIQKWLKDGLKIPAKELAQIILNMSTKGRSSYNE